LNATVSIGGEICKLEQTCRGTTMNFWNICANRMWAHCELHNPRRVRPLEKKKKKSCEITGYVVHICRDRFFDLSHSVGLFMYIFFYCFVSYAQNGRLNIGLNKWRYRQHFKNKILVLNRRLSSKWLFIIFCCLLYICCFAE
jgi:hypothetical protein